MTKNLKSVIYDIVFITSTLFAQPCDNSISNKPKIFYNNLKNILHKPTPIVNLQPFSTYTLSTIKPIITPIVNLQPFPTYTLPTIKPIITPTPIPSVSPIQSITQTVPTIVPTSIPEATNIIEYTFKFNDIPNVLNRHNEERQLNNLTNMIWNTGLQDSSQIWSNTLAESNCVLEHKLFSASQNLYAGYGWIEPNLPNAVQAWLDEKSLLNKPNVTFNEIGHYLIIVSTSLTEVGCASSINVDKNCFVVTCNYN